MQDFEAFFKVATNHDHPHDYQRRLACGGADGATCASRLISIPTGMGKTAAVTLAWLWNRVALGSDAWPRRLVYCLPMRTLVEQTRDEITGWLDRLTREYPDNTDLAWLAEHSPVVLMGGEENDGPRREWDIYPEKPAILIGTQDMLLSRALNRGYGMARARWPMHFALLNNDCLWVMDETQLMGPGLWTSAQLDWLRDLRFHSQRPCATWWMSATIGQSFLQTKDRVDSGIALPDTITTNEVINAERPMQEWKPPKKQEFIPALANAILSEHATNSLSLVVCNTVTTAQRISKELGKDTVLLTSRFRQQDREKNIATLLEFEKARKESIKTNAPLAHSGLICVSTQIIEAGVDVSSRRLWTERAPWPSTAQRLGRLNRDGKLNGEAKAFVFEVPADKNDKNDSPYEAVDLAVAKKIIANDANSDTLKKKSLEPKPEPFPRAFDVHGLFSTEPDAFGGFTDVSLWVRGGDKNADVTVFWRDWDNAKSSPNNSNGPVFAKDEGCAVAIWRFREFAKNAKTVFIWNDHTSKWESIRPDNICPGMVVLLPASSGGYSVGLGWTGDRKDKLSNLPPPGPFDAEGDDDDKRTESGQWVSLADHLSAVEDETKRLVAALALPAVLQNALVRAAALHDIGKSLPQWQSALPEPRPDKSPIWAKAPSLAKRPGMRHEAASALAAWYRYYRVATPADFTALAIYLVAAHHGLVRTALSSRPSPARQPNIAGIPISVPPPVLPFNNWPLDCFCAQDGSDGVFSDDGQTFTPSAPGWSSLVSDLLGTWEANVPQNPMSGAVPESEPHSLNPFRLAFLETLLRAADARASNQENTK